MYHSAEEAPETDEVDVKNPVEGGDTPDVAEGKAGELTPPAESERKCADEGEAGVAASFAPRETLEGVYPHAVVTVRAFRFPDHVLILSLKCTMFISICSI